MFTLTHNVTYQQENEHERREYSFSPDKLTKNTKYFEIMKACSASHNVTYQQENEHERREYSFLPYKLTRNTKYSEIMKVRSTSHNEIM